MSRYLEDRDSFLQKLIFLLRSRTGVRFVRNPGFRIELDMLDGVYGGPVKYIHDTGKVIKLLLNGYRSRKYRFKDLYTAALEIEGCNIVDQLYARCYLVFLTPRSKKLKLDILRIVDPDKKQPRLKDLDIPALYEYLDR